MAVAPPRLHHHKAERRWPLYQVRRSPLQPINTSPSPPSPQQTLLLGASPPGASSQSGRTMIIAEPFLCPPTAVIGCLGRLGATRTTVSTLEPRGRYSYLEMEETWQHHRCHQYCGLKGQSTNLHWPLTYPAKGIHLSCGKIPQYCSGWE